MATTPPDDIADLFGLEPEPAPSTTHTDAAARATEAAEAALAAELAAEIAAGGVADDAPDSRTDRRVDVSWPARLLLADGRVAAVEVRNISDSGIGLLSNETMPASTVVPIEIDVPHPDDGGTPTLVAGIIATTYKVVHGSEMLSGGTWLAAPEGVERLNAWIARLRA